MRKTSGFNKITSNFFYNFHVLGFQEKRLQHFNACTYYLTEFWSANIVWLQFCYPLLGANHRMLKSNEVTLKWFFSRNHTGLLFIITRQYKNNLI